MIKRKILIATGGTGGHIFPAYSLAQVLAKDNDIILTTDKRGFNYIKNYKHLNIVKIPSSPLIKKNIFKFLKSLIIILLSTVLSLFFLISNRPKIIFGMGGYTSFPICIAASILRIKFIIYENNLIIGKANKYLLPFAKKIFVAYSEIEGISQKYKNKIVTIGNLVREEIINFNTSNQDNEKFENLRILILGGSQAAKAFANLLPQVFKKLKDSGISIKIYQQCLKEQNSQLSQFYEKEKIDYEIFNFAENINNYYSKVNLVITRSGASVLGELINVKMPFISIPLPSSAENHQFKNAEFYLKKGYGFLLKEENIEKDLYDLIQSLCKNKSIIEKILSKQRQYSDKNIFRNLINLIEKI